MKKKIFSVLAVLLLASMIVSPVAAGVNIKLSGGLDNVEWSLGSLIAKATLIGVGKTDLTVILDASGDPVITCTNFGSNDVPGQSYPKVTVSGKYDLLGDDPFRKNGKTPFVVETDDPFITWDAAGCPGDNWTARVDFVFWTDATLTVKSLATGDVLFQQAYTCTTNRDLGTVSCKAVH